MGEMAQRFAKQSFGGIGIAQPRKQEINGGSGGIDGMSVFMRLGESRCVSQNVSKCRGFREITIAACRINYVFSISYKSKGEFTPRSL